MAAGGLCVVRSVSVFVGEGGRGPFLNWMSAQEFLIGSDGKSMSLSDD